MPNQDEMMKLRKEIEEKQKKLEQMEKEQGFNPLGEWHFSTEGDVEGRTTTVLGTHTGNIFDGIKKYAGKEYYKLTVRKVGELTEIPKRKTSGGVDVVVYDDFIKMHDKADTANKLAEHLPNGFSIGGSNNYGAVKIIWEEK